MLLEMAQAGAQLAEPAETRVAREKPLSRPDLPIVGRGPSPGNCRPRSCARPHRAGDRAPGCLSPTLAFISLDAFVLSGPRYIFS